MCDKTVQKIFPALGTVNAVTIYDGFGVVAAEHVKKRVLELHRRFSLFAPESDVSKINRQAGIKPVYVHKDTIFVLSNAQKYARGTQGTFDVTAGAASRIWRERLFCAGKDCKLTWEESQRDMRPMRRKKFLGNMRYIMPLSILEELLFLLAKNGVSEFKTHFKKTANGWQNLWWKMRLLLQAVFMKGVLF